MCTATEKAIGIDEQEAEPEDANQRDFAIERDLQLLYHRQRKT